MAEIKVVTGWKMVKEQVKRGYSDLRWPDGNVIRMPIDAITSQMLDAIDDEMKATQPQPKRIPVKGNDGRSTGKFVEDTEDEVYKDALAKHNKLRSLKIILTSIPKENRPEGDEAAQIKALESDLLIGHVTQLVKDILSISNLNLDEAVSEAKND